MSLRVYEKGKWKRTCSPRLVAFPNGATPSSTWTSRSEAAPLHGEHTMAYGPHATLYGGSVEDVKVFTGTNLDEVIVSYDGSGVFNQEVFGGVDDGAFDVRSAVDPATKKWAQAQASNILANKHQLSVDKPKKFDTWDPELRVMHEDAYVLLRNEMYNDSFQGFMDAAQKSYDAGIKGWANDFVNVDGFMWESDGFDGGTVTGGNGASVFIPDGSKMFTEERKRRLQQMTGCPVGCMIRVRQEVSQHPLLVGTMKDIVEFLATQPLFFGTEVHIRSCVEGDEASGGYELTTANGEGTKFHVFIIPPSSDLYAMYRSNDAYNNLVDFVIPVKYDDFVCSGVEITD